MTLVVGATGLLGTEICRRLSAAGESIRAMVRKTSDPAKKSILKELRAELVEGDLKDRASLDRACQRATAVITTPVAIGSKQEGDTFETVDLRGQISLVDAARAASVQHFVFISVSGNFDKHGGNPLVDAKRAVEKHLRQSGLTYTILRPSVFMEIWLSPHLGFDFQNAKATIYGSGENKISYISLDDVARFATVTSSSPAGRNAIIELGGAEALSPCEVVRIFEQTSGRPFAVQFVAEEALQARKAAASNPLEQTLAGLTIAAAHGDEIDMCDTLRKFPLRLKSVREYAKTVLKPSRVP